MSVIGDESWPNFGKRGSSTPIPQAEQIEPRRWLVVLLHNPQVPVEFVIAVLTQYFHRSTDDAYSLSHELRTTGRTIAGIYTYEVAETKMSLLALAARNTAIPLRSMVEPVAS